MTVNVTLSSLRRKGRREEVELNDAIPSSLASPGVNYQRTEIREQVNAALAKLSPEHRAVVVLKDLEDLQYHEIAGGSESLYRYSNVSAFLCPEKTTIHVKTITVKVTTFDPPVTVRKT